MINGLSGPQEISHSGTRNLFRYWESIRGERSAPLRSQIALQHIHQLLPWIFICEPTGESHSHRLRLAGTGICQLWGENMTGKDLFASWKTFERETMNRLLNAAICDLQPFVMRCRARTETGFSTHLEIIGLPVEADDTHANQVLGLVIPFHESNWLCTHHLVSFELVSVRIIWTEPVPAKDSVPVKPVSRGRKFRHLHVIPGGRLQ
jgi:hypothetical protein